MGTHATITFIDNSKPIVKVYFQYDGCPKGVGQQLADLLVGRRIINGISGQTTDTAYNGVGCMAAHVIKSMKDGIGGAYIVPLSHEREEWNYEVSATWTGNIYVSVWQYDNHVGEYVPEEFKTICEGRRDYD